MEIEFSVVCFSGSFWDWLRCGSLRVGIGAGSVNRRTSMLYGVVSRCSRSRGVLLSCGVRVWCPNSKVFMQLRALRVGMGGSCDFWGGSFLCVSEQV